MHKIFITNKETSPEEIQAFSFKESNLMQFYIANILSEKYKNYKEDIYKKILKNIYNFNIP